MAWTVNHTNLFWIAPFSERNYEPFVMSHPSSQCVHPGTLIWSVFILFQTREGGAEVLAEISEGVFEGHCKQTVNCVFISNDYYVETGIKNKKRQKTNKDLRRRVQRRIVSPSKREEEFISTGPFCSRV